MINQSASFLGNTTYCIGSTNSHITTAQKSLGVYSKKMEVTTNLYKDFLLHIFKFTLLKISLELGRAQTSWCHNIRLNFATYQ